MKFQRQFKFIALAGAAALIPSAIHAQAAAPPTPRAAQPQPRPAAPSPAPSTVSAAPAPAAAQPAAELPPTPPPAWSVADAQQLLAYIRAVGKEGLDPQDYSPDALAAAIAGTDPAQLSQVASDDFNRIAKDLALGHVRSADRIDWHIKDSDLDGDRLDTLLRYAVAQHAVPATLDSLLPTHPQYAALKTALADTAPTDTEALDRIRLNLDRWRWLPRDLGQRYIIVNVPAYTAALVENGETVSRHHAVAGKISTPTPQLSATATGVILNPWWEVPTSISGEVAGKKGFVALKDDNGKILRWRQPPGPTNALGQVKFVMPNDKAIYLHDTNAKSRFNSKVRAFSHGCIRTQDILDLATILLTEGGDEWTPDKIKETLASGKSVMAKFPQPLPVYIVYMSSAANVDGRIIDYPDIYKRDGKAIAALNDKGPTKAAAKPPTADKVAAR